MAILLLVKTGQPAGSCEIHYRDIGDYLSRTQKLAIVDNGDLDTVHWETVVPNPATIGSTPATISRPSRRWVSGAGPYLRSSLRDPQA